MDELEQRAAVDQLRCQAEQTREGLVDLSEVPVVAREREQLDLGARSRPRVRELRVGERDD
jgi:hypothetical protein